MQVLVSILFVPGYFGHVRKEVEIACEDEEVIAETVEVAEEVGVYV